MTTNTADDDGNSKEESEPIVGAKEEDTTFKDEEEVAASTSTQRRLLGDTLVAEKWKQWSHWMYGSLTSKLPHKYQLVTDEQVRKRSLYAVRFAVLCSAINTKALNPNFALMVGADPDNPDAFPNTDPFDYNSATYFLPMCSLLGVAISSIFIGGFSDRMGRKKIMLFLGYVTTAGSIVKYFTRHTFWGFCISNFIFGFFLGNLPVGMAYAGDLFTSRKDKEEELGVMVGMFVLGNSGGGIIAILMNDAGLFAPLWVTAFIMGVSCLAMSWYMIDSADLKKLNLTDTNNDDDDDLVVRPEQINKPVMWNVVLGALADNIGSVGLFPLCLSPLAIEQYLSNPSLDEPLMTTEGYQWLSVMVAPLVVPSTKMTPHAFKRIGASGTCVFGNLITAFVTMALLFIGNGEASRANFAGFVTVMYAGFPFTVFSQLTTGPMLDVLAPEDQLGYVQGLNNAAMNFGMAFSPWVLGLLADAAGTNAAIWTGIGISFAAALINLPLTFRPEMGAPKEVPPAARRVLPGEDEEWVNKAIAGEYIPPDILLELNRLRLQKGKPFITPKVKSYAEDKDSLDVLRQHAQETFEFRQMMNDRVLRECALTGTSSDLNLTKQDLCNLLNLSYAAAEDSTAGQEAKQDLGQWIVDYLQDNGYHPHTASILIKQMVLSSFPTITMEKEYTPDNLEQTLLQQRRVFQGYVSSIRRRRGGSTNKLSLDRSMANGHAPVFYS